MSKEDLSKSMYQFHKNTTSPIEGDTMMFTEHRDKRKWVYSTSDEEIGVGLEKEETKENNGPVEEDLREDEIDPSSTNKIS